MRVDSDRLAERLAAVERRLTDADADEPLPDLAAIEGRLAELEERADDIDARVGDLESGLQAVRGYVGGIDAVDESVERRADAALAKAEKVESRLADDPALSVERVAGDDGTNVPDGGPSVPADGSDGDRRLVDRIRDAL